MKNQIIHCSYHKCLTMYYHRVMSWMFNRIIRGSSGYRHFDSRIDEFYDKVGDFRVASINNRALDLEKLGNDIRITRFVRDPRDMVVSGYFYHKRGAENWCNIEGRDNVNWSAMNGNPPQAMDRDRSFSQHLQSLNEEDGLIAEIEFRKHHFDSMAAWPANDERVKVFRYEDILGNEIETFRDMFEFYGMSWPTRTLGLALAKRFSAQGKSQLKSHIRNPKSGQWKERFSPRVVEYFELRHPGVIARYGYEPSECLC